MAGKVNIQEMKRSLSRCYDAHEIKQFSTFQGKQTTETDTDISTASGDQVPPIRETRKWMEAISDGCVVKEFVD